MISKTNFLTYSSCPKCLWLALYNSSVGKEQSDLDVKTIETGKLFGKYARQYFPNTFDASRIDKNGNPDTLGQVKATKVAMELGYNAIAEASFIYEDLYCAVDILVKNEDGWDIYEVKGSSKVKPEHVIDIAFQKYVLTKAGLDIKNTYLMHVNSGYVRHGDIDVHQLFAFEKIDDTEDLSLIVSEIDDQIPLVRKLIKEKNEPRIDFSSSCKECKFHDYCTRDLPKNNISEIQGIHSDVAYANINAGIITVKDYIASGKSFKSKRQKVQVEAILNNVDRIIDKKEIENFLDTLSYPLYHLDFETMNEGVPPFDGARPYEQIPFQYSLHIEVKKDGPYIHKEFLGEKLNCDYELAKQLLEDIPPHACVMAYHKSTEENIIKHLAEKYPDLREELLKRVEDVVDLMIPFSKGYYYDIKQGSSNSIKHTMPALCPHMEESYHNLPVVHNGGEALAMFPKLMNMEGNEYKETREGMLKYCELDTWSMVEILKVLYKVIDE